MSVGSRLREERVRLSISQAKLAASMGVAKNTAINWEKDASSPTAAALIAFAEAGADALYILTGRRSAPDPTSAVRSIEDDLAQIKRRLLDPSRDAMPGESEHDAADRARKDAAHLLERYCRYDAESMSPEQLEETKSLLAIVNNNAKYATYRAADLTQQRGLRARMKESLAGWFDDEEPAGWHGPPAAPALNILASLALEYGAPVKLLVELVAELREDAATRQAPADG